MCFKRISRSLSSEPTFTTRHFFVGRSSMPPQVYILQGINSHCSAISLNIRPFHRTSLSFHFFFGSLSLQLVVYSFTAEKMSFMGLCRKSTTCEHIDQVTWDTPWIACLMLKECLCFLWYMYFIIYRISFFFQPSTLALALLSCELMYVSNNWLLATHYLQQEAKVSIG